MVESNRKVFISLIVVSTFIFFSLIPSISQAAIVHDSTSSATTGSSQLKTLSWIHTTSGTERILIVGVSLNANTVVSSVTYAGLPLTKIIAYESGDANRVSLWYRLNPPTGTGTVAVTVSATSARFVAGASSYTGINQVTPFGTPSTNRGTGTLGSVVVTSASNETAIDVLARRGDLTTNPITQGSGQVSRWNIRTTLNNANTGITGGSSNKPGASSVTMSWSWAASRAWSMAGISLKPSLPLADTTPPLRSNGLPNGTLAFGTTQTTMSLATDESATCKYGTTAGTAYASLPNTFTTTGGTTHSVLLIGLTNGTPYTFFVRCVDTSTNANADDFTVSFSIATDTTPPSTPQNFLATAVSPTEIDLSWSESTDNVGVVGYRVYRDDVHTDTATSPVYQDAGLLPLTMYSYKVSAVDAEGNESAFSNSVEATTLMAGDTTPPSTPQNLSAVAVSSSEIALNWTASSDDIGVVGYNIFRDAVLIASTPSSSYSDIGLAQSTVYIYTVSAYDGAGNQSGQSESAMETTPASPDITPPSVPQNLLATAVSYSEVDLSWSLSTDDISLAGYKIYRDDILIASSIFTNYVDTGVLAAVTYTYAVSAFDVAGNESDRSSSAQVVTPSAPDTTPPNISNTIPSGIFPSFITSTTLGLETDEIATCRYDVVEGTAYPLMSNIFSVTGGTTHQDVLTGLMEGTSYTFYVRCSDTSNNVNDTDATVQFSIASFTDDEPPTIPNNLEIVSVSPTTVQFLWSPSIDSVGVSGYKVFRDNQLIATTPNTEYSDFGLLEATAYYYTVSAYDAELNESAQSDALLVTTIESDIIAPVISDIVVDNITTNSAIVSWRTDELSTSRVEYGFSGLYGAEVFDSTLSTGHSISLVGLSSGALYHFRLRSTDGSGNTAMSFDQTFTTLFAPDTTPPGAINDLSISDTGQTFVNLSWTAPGDDDFMGQAMSYDIRYSTSPITETNWSLATELTGEPAPALSGSIQHYLVIGLTQGITYYFAIRTVDNANNISNISNVVSSATRSAQIGSGGGGGYYIDLVPPEQPTAFHAIATEDSILLLWKNPIDADFVRVVIVRKKGGAPVNLGDGDIIYEGDKETFTDTKIEKDTVYYYGIFAYDREPNYSDVLVAQTQQQSNTTQVEVLTTKSSEQEEGVSADVIAEEVVEDAVYSDDNIQKTSTFRFTVALFFGMQHADVGELQKFLSRDINIYPQGFVTGFFGNLTREAVRRFQCTHSIVCSGDEQSTGHGRVGPVTRTKLNEFLSSEGGLTQTKELIQRTLLFGVRSAEVEMLQQFFAKDEFIYPEGLITGYFGNLTREAVKKFQCLHNIVCEGDEATTGYGKVGPRTRAKINEVYRSE
jgi:chitodextrinase/peptidoglycan hydrolase-like protein with peptidoglycan-binding domain